MPKRRLMLMGLLAHYPDMSPVYRRFVNPSRHKYTNWQKKHIVATYFTPGVSLSWIAYQWEKAGLDPEGAMRRMRHIAYHSRWKMLWQHLGQENVLHIGRQEAIRYALRRNPNTHFVMPLWMKPILLDLRKEGYSSTEIGDMLNVEGSRIRHFWSNRNKSIFG